MCSAPWPHPTHGPTKCGQCMECRLAYSREWAIRMTHEAQLHDKSCFLTLTYDQEHLPEHGQLIKRHLQAFFKRLRRSHGPFRYVACGEYGERRRRPHFHVAVFGIDFSADRLLSGRGVQDHDLYQSASLSQVWTAGTHQIGELSFESCAYIARYITKRISGKHCASLPLAVLDDGELVFPEPEFLLCSRRPGIGSGWFDRHFQSDVFPHGRVITAQGTPAPIPQFYRRKVRKANLGLSMQLSQTIAINNAKVHTVAQLRTEDSPQRRAARSKYAEARTGAFAREVKE